MTIRYEELPLMSSRILFDQTQSKPLQLNIDNEYHKLLENIIALDDSVPINTIKTMIRQFMLDNDFIIT